MRYVIGIDQGHSQTRAVVCDLTGVILGVGIAPGACHVVHGIEQAMASVQQAATQALAQAGVAPPQVAIVMCGLTGADWPDEYRLLHKHVEQLGLGQSVRIKNDVLVALRGGTWMDYGAVVVGGTGSNCAIRSPHGEEFIYGYYYDLDLQGSFGLALRALAAIRRAATGRESPTVLTERILALLGYHDIESLVRKRVEDHLRLEDAQRIAPVVFQAAREGDIVAAKIIRAFGEGLAEMVIVGLQRFHMTRLAVDVVLSGNLFRDPSPLLSETIAAAIHVVAPRARLIHARYEPVVGAALLGLAELGVAMDAHLRQQVETSCQRWRLIRRRRPAPHAVRTNPMR
ncbi:MAG: N-acetylglucosamine kinase [Anaerolineae bacterium]